VADEYASGKYRYWHLSMPSPELTHAIDTEGRSCLRPGGRFLLRACLRVAGIRNDLDETALRSVFAGWRVRSIISDEIPTDDRMMQAIVARLEHE
jgi:hypothetical protein